MLELKNGVHTFWIFASSIAFKWKEWERNSSSPIWVSNGVSCGLIAPLIPLTNAECWGELLGLLVSTLICGHTTNSHTSHIIKGHFAHETECPWPLHLKHSHWWKRRSRSKFTLHYAWGTNGVCECKMDVKSMWDPTGHHMDHVSWSLELFSKTTSRGWPNTKSGDHDIPNPHNRWFILFNHVRGPAWIEIHWNSIWLRA